MTERPFVNGKPLWTEDERRMFMWISLACGIIIGVALTVIGFAIGLLI